MKEEKVIFESKSGRGVLLSRTEGCEFVRLTIHPHSKIENHSLDVPVNFYVIEGSALLNTGGKVHKLSAGDLISIPPNILREWENSGDKSLEILVVKELSQNF